MEGGETDDRHPGKMVVDRVTIRRYRRERAGSAEREAAKLSERALFDENAFRCSGNSIFTAAKCRLSLQ
jgi:hypothetical protein